MPIWSIIPGIAGGENVALFWGNKRYHTWNYQLRQTFGEKVAKVSLDAGFSCPNRALDGSGGCIYCSPRGSGDCAGDRARGVEAQFEQVKARIREKWAGVSKYIAYFQAYTNTLAPVATLEGLYREALSQPGVVGLSVSTRPDCLPEAVLDLLEQLNRETWLWVELGLQSVHDETLRLVNRGHDYACFLRAVEILRARGIRICAHIILGLPGETPEMMMETAHAVAGLQLQGIKIHVLHVVKNTGLARMWDQGEVSLPDMETYARWVVDTLEVLPPEMVVQRVTGDAPAEILLAPTWIRRKWETLQLIDRIFLERNTWQGRKYLGE